MIAPCETSLKKLVKDQSVLDLGVLWNDIKDLELGLCKTCMKSRMHGFPIPSLISRKKNGIFENITYDYCPMKILSTRRYTETYAI
jgi:hypothetical protein